jgi:hypothetical protein
VRKLRFIFFVALIVYSVDSSSQILIGPVLGGQLGWATFDDKDNKDIYRISPNLGFHAGVSTSFRVRKRFFLQTSIQYSRKSKTIEGKNDRALVNEAKYNYLDMPILYTAEFKGKLGKKSNREFKWYLGVGPTVSYWLGGKGTLSNSDLEESNIAVLPYEITFDKNENDVQEGEMNIQDANRIQLALNISAGLILEPVGFHKIMVAMRYEFGHSFLSRTSDGYFGGYDGVLFYEDELQVRMQTLNLSLHYFIDLKTDQRNKGKSTIKTKKGKLRR